MRVTDYIIHYSINLSLLKILLQLLQFIIIIDWYKISSFEIVTNHNTREHKTYKIGISN